MAKNRSSKCGNKVGRNASRTDEARATGGNKRPPIKKKKAAQTTSGRRGVKRPAVAPGTVGGAKPSSGRPNKGSRAEKAAGPKPASRLRLATIGDSQLLEQSLEASVNHICTEVVRPLGDQLEQSREEVRSLRRDLPKMIFDGLQNFFRRGDVPLDTGPLPAGRDNHQSFNEAGIPDDGRDQLDGGQQGRSAGTPAVVHMSSGDSDDAVSPARTEADYNILYDYGRARRQLPLELLLEMYKAGAIAGTGPNGDDDPKKGLEWNKSPQSNQTTLRAHRDVLEKLGFIHIPHRTRIREEAKKRAGRKGDAAGPGYLTTKAVNVCRYVLDQGLEKSVTSKSRRTR